jgi:hypothetical protein
MSDDCELGLEMLLAVKAELDVDLDDELLSACFEIQKKYQYSHDRTLSTQAMDRLIEDRVEKIGRNQTEDGA